MLLKFKIEPENDQKISDEGIIKYNDKLRTFGLVSFQHRLMNKIITFTNKKVNNPCSPAELKDFLNPEDIASRENFTVLRNKKTYNKDSENIIRYNQ